MTLNGRNVALSRYFTLHIMFSEPARPYLNVNEYRPIISAEENFSGVKIAEEFGVITPNDLPRQTGCWTRKQRCIHHFIFSFSF